MHATQYEKAFNAIVTGVKSNRITVRYLNGDGTEGQQTEALPFSKISLLRRKLAKKIYHGEINPEYQPKENDLQLGPSTPEPPYPQLDENVKDTIKVTHPTQGVSMLKRARKTFSEELKISIKEGTANTRNLELTRTSKKATINTITEALLPLFRHNIHSMKITLLKGRGLEGRE